MVIIIINRIFIITHTWGVYAFIINAFNDKIKDNPNERKQRNNLIFRLQNFNIFAIVIPPTGIVPISTFFYI